MAAKNEVPSEVEAALSSPKIEPAPPTLEEAREAPGRAEKIAEIEKRIESEGIEYVFFQQISISGHINGKGVVASWFPKVAARGYQLVYGATADLFTDRQGNYIGFGPEESELAAMADLDTFEALPWDPRVARVYCDCYDTETGELLDADPRQNLKRVAHEVEEELGYSFLCGIEPEMMWMKIPEPGEEPEGVTKPWCYHINQFEQLQPVILDVVAYGKAMGLDMSYGDHEDAPGSWSSTSASTVRCGRRTTSAPTARSAAPWGASTASTHRSCRNRSPGCPRTGTTITSLCSMGKATTSFTTRTGRRSSQRWVSGSWAGSWTTSGRWCVSARRRSTPTRGCGTSASGRPSTRTTAGRTAPARCGSPAAAASSFAEWTPPATRT